MRCTEVNHFSTPFAFDLHIRLAVLKGCLKIILDVPFLCLISWTLHTVEQREEGFIGVARCTKSSGCGLSNSTSSHLF